MEALTNSESLVDEREPRDAERHRRDLLQINAVYFGLKVRCLHTKRVVLEITSLNDTSSSNGSCKY